MPIIVLDAMPKYIRCISSCSVVSFKRKLDCYLKNIVDFPGRPRFSNNLDSWRDFTMVDTAGGPGFQLDAAEQPQVSQVRKYQISKCKQKIVNLLFLAKTNRKYTI